ncbi:hypothetical protein M2271_000965 [Streptomyces sp. LBL]|nr:hypothetical protein [Streptomyces sp. LBL]
MGVCVFQVAYGAGLLLRYGAGDSTCAGGGDEEPDARTGQTGVRD